MGDNLGTFDKLVRPPGDDDDAVPAGIEEVDGDNLLGTAKADVDDAPDEDDVLTFTLLPLKLVFTTTRSRGSAKLQVRTASGAAASHNSEWVPKLDCSRR